MGDNTSTLCGRFSTAQFVGRGVIPMMHFSGVHGRCILEHPLSLAVVSATWRTSGWLEELNPSADLQVLCNTTD